MAAPISKRVRSESVAPTVVARSSSSPEQEESLELVQAKPAALQFEFTDCIAICHSDTYEEKVDAWAESSESQWIQDLDAIIGRYWRVSTATNGYPAYKKESGAQDPWARKDLFLYFCSLSTMRGWVVTTDLVFPASDSNTIAWGPEATDRGTWPEKLHLPFWSKKANPLVAALAALLLRSAATNHQSLSV